MADVQSVNTPSDGRLKTRRSDEILQLVGFKLGQELFGVDILKVQDINRMMEVTKIPRSPQFVEGVINLRGTILPVLDLRKRFGLEETEYTRSTRIIVVRVNEQVIGFVVDAVEEVLRIPSSTVEPPPPIVAGIDSEYIEGVGRLKNSKNGKAENLLILLNLDKVLLTNEQDLMKKVVDKEKVKAEKPVTEAA